MSFTAVLFATTVSLTIGFAINLYKIYKTAVSHAFPTHNRLTTLIEKLGYGKEFSKGICHGFTIMQILAAQQGQHEHFMDRLKFINAHSDTEIIEAINRIKSEFKSNPKFKTDERDTMFMEIASFLECVVISQSDTKAEVLLDKLTWQNDFKNILPLVQSIRLGNKINFAVQPVLNTSANMSIFNTATLLKKLTHIVEQDQILTFKLGNAGHVVTLLVTRNKIELTDINTLYQGRVSSDTFSFEELARIIQQGWSKYSHANITFNLTLIGNYTKSTIKKIDACIATLESDHRHHDNLGLNKTKMSLRYNSYNDIRAILNNNISALNHNEIIEMIKYTFWYKILNEHLYLLKSINLNKFENSLNATPANYLLSTPAGLKLFCNHPKIIKHIKLHKINEQGITPMWQLCNNLSTWNIVKKHPQYFINSDFNTRYHKETDTRYGTLLWNIAIYPDGPEFLLKNVHLINGDLNYSPQCRNNTKGFTVAYMLARSEFGVKLFYRNPHLLKNCDLNAGPITGKLKGRTVIDELLVHQLGRQLLIKHPELLREVDLERASKNNPSYTIRDELLYDEIALPHEGIGSVNASMPIVFKL